MRKEVGQTDRHRQTETDGQEGFCQEETVDFRESSDHGHD